ncbi:hypothetical protein MASR2M70_20540 [Bacillota bacterium]
MPVMENAVSTRLEIMQTLYKLSGKKAGNTVRFFPAQINGAYYSEISHQMRFLQEKGLVAFKKNMVSTRFMAELTEEGLAFMEDAYKAAALPDTEKDEALKELFKKLKI